MNGYGRVALVSVLLITVASASGRGQSPPTVATISVCRFANDVTIAPCRVAYRAFGQLNQARIAQVGVTRKNSTSSSGSRPGSSTPVIRCRS